LCFRFVLFSFVRFLSLTHFFTWLFSIHSLLSTLLLLRYCHRSARYPCCYCTSHDPVFLV
jgi:hypothetical protein